MHCQTLNFCDSNVLHPRTTHKHTRRFKLKRALAFRAAYVFRISSLPSTVTKDLS